MKSLRMNIIAPALIALLLGGSIMGLVFQLVSFSERVTDYYTPTILVSDNLLDAAEHLRDSITQDGKNTLHGHTAAVHFQKTTLKFDKVMLSSHIDVGHFDMRLAELPKKVLWHLQSKEIEKAMSLLQKIVELAKQNSEQHTLELEQAKVRIQQMTSLIGGLSLLVLLLGVYFTIRENKLSLARQNEATAIAAVTALIKALEARDPYTKGHSARVACLSHCLAKQIGFDELEAENIRLAAIMHDIGKIGIPDHILLKESKLTDEEFETIKQHPELGARIISHAENLSSILPAVLHHHERPDGKGYPHGLLADEIPLHAQIISITDAYDAMTSTRPYRKALSRQFAIEELRKGIGIQWTEELVEPFIKMWQECPQLTAHLEEAVA